MSQIDVSSSIVHIDADSEIQHIEVMSSTQVINVNPVTSEVCIILAGPPGPPGPPLPPSSTAYTHIQNTPSLVWTIHHNLGFKPNVTAFESDDVVIYGELLHVDVNTLTITYPVLISGFAFLS